MSAEMTVPDIQNLSGISSGSQAEQVKIVQSAQLVDSSSRPLMAEEEQSQQQPSREEVANIVVELNSLAQNLQRSLMFSVDEKSGETFVKVLDKETEETIREIPSQAIRDIKAKLGETVGLLFKDSS
jgi:flagellar protein FlaG